MTVDPIEQEASGWLARRDGGAGSPEEQAQFERWLDADIRHRVAYLKIESTWRRADRLRDLAPLDGGADPDLLRPPAPRRWPLALAASLFLALVTGAYFLHQYRSGWQHYHTPVGGFARIVLDDGSVVDLNTDSEIRVRLEEKLRDLRLVRGEGRFTVAHDKTRPFVVSAADTAVRAVGTAFAVRVHDAKRVDVLVAEGSVAIAAAAAREAPPLTAGEAAVVQGDQVSVIRVEPELMERRLAWTSGRLQFRGESLRDAVAEFNRYNRRQIRIADASLDALRVGGNFSATDPESFAAAVSSSFGLRADASEPGAITLRPP